MLKCCRLQLVVVLSYYFLSVAESDNPWPRQCCDECRDCSRELQQPAVTSHLSPLQAGEIRRRLSECVNAPKSKSGFKRDPEDPSAAVLKEPWEEKVNISG